MTHYSPHSDLHKVTAHDSPPYRRALSYSGPAFGRLRVAGALAAGRGSPCPSLSPRARPAGASAVGSPPPGEPGRRFCAPAGGAGSPAAPARAVLGRARPPPLKRGGPPPRRAAARLCSSRLPPPALARLRAGPLALPAGPLSGPWWALVPAPAGPPSRAGGSWGLGLSRRLPARGLSRRFAALRGAAFRAPARSGLRRLRAAVALRPRPVKAKASALRAALTCRRHRAICS